jgi:hypothetical protein
VFTTTFFFFFFIDLSEAKNAGQQWPSTVIKRIKWLKTIKAPCFVCAPVPPTDSSSNLNYQRIETNIQCLIYNVRLRRIRTRATSSLEHMHPTSKSSVDHVKCQVQYVRQNHSYSSTWSTQSARTCSRILLVQVYAAISSLRCITSARINRSSV